MATTTGPKTSPIKPNADIPPSSATNVTSPFIDERPLSSSGRRMLSAMPTSPPPIPISTRPRVTSPVSRNHNATGAQTIDDPTTGTSDMNAITVPHTAGARTPTIQNPRPPRKPCTAATASPAMTLANTRSSTCLTTWSRC